MYKINIILFCSMMYWSLYGMEENIKTPPGSPQHNLFYNFKKKPSTLKLNFENDTDSDLDIFIYVGAAQKMQTFSLYKGATYCSTTTGDTNQFLSLKKLNRKVEPYPIMIDMHSSFIGKNRNIKETICVNTDSIFLYYDFLQNPVTLNITISLQRIWAHAEQA